MSSKKIGSPLAAIFQQWTAQQQQQTQQQQQRSYRILLQTSYSLQDRITAAEPVENVHVYQRAKQATPSEKSMRDILGGQAWLLRLIELAANAAVNSGEEQEQTTPSVWYVVTQPNSVDILQMLSPELQRRVKVLDLAIHDPWGWDSDVENKESEEISCNLSNFASILRDIQKMASDNPIILIWQSLMPLLDIHGFSKVMRSLKAMPNSLQVWPVQRQGLSGKQHAQLEDMANALMSMQGGDMTMIREGIREQGNVLRESVPFRFVSEQHNLHGDDAGTARTMYRIVEGAGDGENELANKVGDSATSKNTKVAKSTPDQDSSVTTSTSQRGRPRVQLQMEDETEGGNKSNATPSRPKIYFQDDDPEFDDLDEEDPDDDLEI